MQIGVIGLGRMGGNIVRRLQKHGHQCIAYDRNARAVGDLVEAGATGAEGLEDLVSKFTETPRVVWVMLPAGTITGETVDALGKLLSSGDILIDGGNSFYKDDIHRGQALKEKGIHYVDVGTSGGVWGLERGYCMMVGGAKEAVDTIDPILDALAPGIGDIPRTPGREKLTDTRAERGYIHAGPTGAGHFVKMVHNGIEYGLMQAYAEGFDILKKQELSRPHRETSASTSTSRTSPRSGAAAASISSWLLDLTASALTVEPQARALLRRGGRFRRRPLDHRGRDRGGGAGQRAVGRPLHPLPLARRAHVRREGPVGHALRLRRPRRAPRRAGARGRQHLMNPRRAEGDLHHGPDRQRVRGAERVGPPRPAPAPW